MTSYTCDGCGALLDPRTQVYYTVGELNKHVPKKPYKVIFRDGPTTLSTEDTGWVSYDDLHYCEQCVAGPIDVAERIRAYATQ